MVWAELNPLTYFHTHFIKYTVYTCRYCWCWYWLVFAHEWSLFCHLLGTKWSALNTVLLLYCVLFTCTSCVYGHRASTRFLFILQSVQHLPELPHKYKYLWLTQDVSPMMIRATYLTARLYLNTQSARELSIVGADIWLSRAWEMWVQLSHTQLFLPVPPQEGRSSRGSPDEHMWQLPPFICPPVF